ncbi:glycoside hydrolase family 25 protein [Neohortaea acidophila]|uniref:N,O-diacetylmuramidase n=1 Tax=Neohortaea acidophila TaxID=245834 RepID=A0A6A6PIT0_9PEZI|nr:glycoside hydrolase family 25 protein [Neohortaea acidophila]KAF2479696.1 glycoside hydrolase family 25 protein [Neohortaea acidophila]
MKKAMLTSALAATAAARSMPHFKRQSNSSTVQGFDVSGYQPNVNWDAAYNGGLRFVYIKATQSTDYTNPDFSSQYEGATNAGFIRGAYHFADGTVSASAQVSYFAQNGGGWSSDGITLPGMLDLEGDCIGVDWIQEFSDGYYNMYGVYPVLYSSPSWWEQCTGNSNAFVNTNPLFMACYDSTPCTPQGGWPYFTFWQYADSNTYGGDSDLFNGDYSQLQTLATNG